MAVPLRVVHALVEKLYQPVLRALLIAHKAWGSIEKKVFPRVYINSSTKVS